MLCLALALIVFKPASEPIFQFQTGFGSRTPFIGPPQIHKNIVVSELADGTWTGITSSDSDWFAIKTNPKGLFTGKECDGGWIDLHYDSPKNQVVLMDAEGDSFASVNGVLEVGDVYESGYAKLPVELKKGSNDFLFRCVRGEFKCQLLPTGPRIALDPSDTTLPDFRPMDAKMMPGSIIVRNATLKTLSDLSIECIQGGSRTFTKVDPILPLGMLKAGFKINTRQSPNLVLHLLEHGKTVNEAKIQLRSRKRYQTYKETFYSQIDGSVQYFAVNPAWKSGASGLALSMHGAGVEAIGQADAYSSKPWANIVCPTNRRPFGFDWEDWGRIDALEVLKIAENELHPSPSEIYLIGHSMGGHGTIINGALYPGKFAAIAPSAGWISAESYAGYRPIKNPTGVMAALQRASMMDSTLRYLPNYKAEGVYLLQGAADDTVPPAEETHLAALLSTFHKDYIFNLVPKMGHWWDIDPEPGADCIDLAALWDFLAEHRLPKVDQMHHIDFSTSDPEVSASCYWSTVEQQIEPLKLSRVQLYVEPFLRRISGTTKNVMTLKLNLSPLAPRLISGNKNLKVNLDGQKLVIENVHRNESVMLKLVGGKWTSVSSLDPTEKSPERYGPLRLGFQHRFVYVYGTHGTPAENQWAIAKTRFDEETWWYRANGEFLAIPDTEFKPGMYKNRSVVLVGNSQTNSAWKSLLGACPVQVGEGTAMVGGQKFSGDGISGLWLYSRAGSSSASVIAISGSGIVGMHGTDLLGYLQPMTGYPDYFLFDHDAITPGPADGLLAGGYFDQKWNLVSP